MNRGFSGVLGVLIGPFFLLVPPLAAQTISFQEHRVVPLQPASVVVGPGNEAWFTDPNANKIGRIALDGTLQTYSLSPNSRPSHIAVVKFLFGGSVTWFTESDSNKIGRITDAGVTELAIPTPSSNPTGIASGGSSLTNPNLSTVWFTEFSGNKIGRASSDGSLSEIPVPTMGSGPWGIAVGSEVWFTEFIAGKIGRYDPVTGLLTEYTIPTHDSGPREITVAGDGSAWFTEFNVGKVGRITQAGAITEFATGSSDSGPLGIAAGSAGEIWFTEQHAGRVGVVNPDSVVREFSLPTSASNPEGIAFGVPADPIGHFTSPKRAALWVAEASANQLAAAFTDLIVIAGAGASGDWDTEVQISNREKFSLSLNLFGVFGQNGVPASTGGIRVPLSAGGSTRLTAKGLGSGEWSIWFLEDLSFFLPAVNVRVFQRSRPGISGGLPAIRLSTLEKLDATVLSFPGARRLPGFSRSNLVLGGLGSGRIRVEAVTAQGEVLGSSEFAFPGSLFLTDVLSKLGVNTLDIGQIRVTRLLGVPFWGYLATADQDGSLVVTTGANP
jgi:virginiamycin B lyase